jgi:hypothetical protein
MQHGLTLNHSYAIFNHIMVSDELLLTVSVVIERPGKAVQSASQQ